MNANLTSQRGFSLIELMIAMTVTVVIACIASTLVAQSLRMRSREDGRSDAIADAHRALNIVSREIANSGFGLMDNGLVPEDTGEGSIRFRANLNAYALNADGTTPETSKFVQDADEDIKYTMYNDDAANRHYLVRYDAILGATDPRKGTTVLANRLDSFRLQYFDSTGTELDVEADPFNVRNARKVRITVGVILPPQGTPGSPGYQPQSTIDLVTDTVLRNASQITF